MITGTVASCPLLESNQVNRPHEMGVEIWCEPFIILFILNHSRHRNIETYYIFSCLLVPVFRLKWLDIRM